MCASDGGVVDDLIVYRTGDEAFLVCVNAGNIEKDFGWFLKQAERWEPRRADRGSLRRVRPARAAGPQSRRNHAGHRLRFN